MGLPLPLRILPVSYTHLDVYKRQAFTQIDYAGAAMPEGRAEMILNRPFIYAVTTSNGMILFVGICNNPVA